MIQLKKTKATEWLGNGMGTAAAKYVVVGHEDIVIEKGHDGWIARNEETMTTLVRPYGWTKKEVIKMVAEMIENKLILGRSR